MASWTWRLTVAHGGQKPAVAISMRGAFVERRCGDAPGSATHEDGKADHGWVSSVPIAWWLPVGRKWQPLRGGNAERPTPSIA